MGMALRALERLKFRGPVRELFEVSKRTQILNAREEVSMLETSTKAFHFSTVDDVRLTSWKAATYENPSGPPH